MNVKDVTIVIDRQTKAVTQKGFGLPLILSTAGAKPYKEYAELTEIAADYPEATAAYKIANRILGQNPRPEKVAIFGILYDPVTDTPPEIVAALNDLVEFHNDFYYLYTDQNNADVVKAIDTWIAAHKKLYFFDTDDLTLVPLVTSENTVPMFHHDLTQYAGAGWIGRCAPEEPGSITWKFKTINGVTEANIGLSELEQLHEDGGNTYIEKLGVLQSSEGLTASGDYIDLIQSQHYIEARLSEAVHRLLFTQKKVPLTDAGIAQIESEMRGVFIQSTTQGIIATDENGNGMWSITKPRRADVPVNDRAARKLSGLGFEFTVAGAVHNVTIRGTMVV